MNRTTEIELLIRSRYSILYVVSWEEQRVIEEIINIGRSSNKKVYEWSCSGGIVPAGTHIQAQKMRNAGTKDPLVALNEVVEQVEPAIYLFKDFHPFLAGNNFSIIRKLRDISQNLKSSYKTLVLLSPFMELPRELEKDVTIIDYPLPGLKELGQLLDSIVMEVRDNPKVRIELNKAGREAILKASLGLTLAEAENVFAKALVADGKLTNDDVEKIFTEKRQIIRKTGLLDYYDPETNFEHIGGLAHLKEWLAKRKTSFSDKARKFGLPTPRGLLLVGVQGCGKSMCAKAISAMWQLPLLRFDIGRMFNSLVGGSEENIRRAIRIAESIAPCILWIDEIDKAFAAMSGHSTDSGTSQRVLGTILTWLSEKKASVFVTATANNVQVLPPELLRKGRFDEIFFVDLPNEEERRHIFQIHLNKRKRNAQNFDLDLLTVTSDGLNGAEIEEAIVTALYGAFYQNRDIETDDIVSAIGETVPLSKTMEDTIVALRQWGASRVRSASRPFVTSEQPLKRKLEID